ncbi:MAG: hypothetical protein AB7O49_10140 [Sphingomonadales bacterium]
MAQELFKGARPIDAHERAGYARNSGNATRINGLESVQQRVRELHSEAAAALVRETTVIDKTYVLQETRLMYEASKRAAVGIGEDGNVVVDVKAANVASRFIDQLGKHVDVRAWSDQQDINLTVTVDSALSRLGSLTLEGEYTVAD